jgi:flagellar biogenesis protein FliO
MAFHPVIILAVVIVFVTLSAWFVPRIVRTLARLFRRAPNVKSATA